MASTYTTNLGIEKPGSGEQAGTWGSTVNTNYDMFDQAICGQVAVNLAATGSSGSPNDIDITDGAVSDGRNAFIELTDGGDLGGDAYVRITPNDAEKICWIRNSLSAARNIFVFQGTYNASNDYTLAAGDTVLLKFDGAGAGAVVSVVMENINVTAVTATNLTGTLQTAAQTNVTSLGTLTALDVDNININANTISATSGAVNITPAAGSAIVLDGTINVDAGVVTGATSITSTNFTGTLVTAAQPNITSVGTLTTFTSTGIDDNATSEQLQISDTRIDIGQPLFILEAASAEADVTAYGQFWVESTTPNKPWFTNDAGTDHCLTQFTRSITVEDPSNAEDISIYFDPKAHTITEMRAVLVGSATPSVTWTIKHGTDRNAAGAAVVTAGTTTTSTTTGSDVTAFNDATIVADSFVWLETTAQSGTVDELHITIVARYD